MTGDKKLENPFKGMAYITEKGVQPEKVLECYSIYPLKTLFHYFNEQMNYFIVGRDGVGKTMILALFDIKYQEALYSKNSRISEVDRNKILDLLPNEVIGIYTNMDRPLMHLTRFHGKIQSEENWKKIFGDYFGHIILKNLIKSLEELPQEWRDNNKVAELDKKILDKISIGYSRRISNELSDAQEISSWDDLKRYIDDRISNWIRAASKLGEETFSGPNETVQLINPCLYLMKELKFYGILSANCRLFIIIDQYETLYEYRKYIDFRPVFNLAMRQAARGETRIEFKIGVRPYGYKDNFEVFELGSKLDSEKEYKEISIDDLTSKYYKEFVEDLTVKCLKKHEYHNFATKSRVHELFENLTEIGEVKEYVKKSKNTDKHFSHFFNKVNPSNTDINKEKIIAIIKGITKNYEKIECKVWVETVLSIYAERYLDSNIDIKSNGLKSHLNEHFKCLQSILIEGCGIVGECDCGGPIKSKDREYDRKKNTYRDIKSGALFIIATSYKNVPKIHSGFNTLSEISSRIVLHYIETVSQAFNDYLLMDGNGNEPLTAKMQSDALYKSANTFFEKIPDKTPNGTAVSQFLRNLGMLLRNLQLDPKLNIPHPNGFSLTKELINQFDKNSREADIMTELLSYGFLEEEKHNDKNSSKPKRYKYYLNRLLCPYFGISIIHKKDPFYVHGDESEFLKCLIEEDCTEVKKFLKSVTGVKTVTEERSRPTDLTSFIGD